MNVFKELGANFGILLSEKDSISYPQTLAPELRALKNRRKQVHHIPDYIGTAHTGRSGKEERNAHIEQIISICREHDYTHLFAGYGFMAEDAEFVARVEKAGICFVGPNSRVIQQAGAKDQAKQLARSLNVSVIPGEDRITALTLLRKAGNSPTNFFRKLAKKHDLNLPENWESAEVLEQAETVLRASYDKQTDLFSLAELQAETVRTVEKLWQKNPGKHIRLKHIGGGGGKGQRVITAVDEVADAVMAVLIESKATGIGDNKNFLIELNIENTRHNEIQLLGNGKWCLELGGRDCSLQMHEQKLLEVSLTEEMLEAAAKEYENVNKSKQAQVIRKDAKMLKLMCKQAEEFGEALNLDSVSTFECIVENDAHYFMEVNTRIQVEHRVTEMAYRLRFTNPDDPENSFTVDSLVATMLLLACYGERLPRPERLPRFVCGIEARLNATNHALKPHAGGTVRAWSAPGEHEIRDDQGIGIPNPDTGLLLPYHLAGAYDSNVALSITHGTSRRESFEKLAEILRCTEVRGHDLHLNLDFHYGLLHWLLGNEPLLKPNTRFVSSYLALAGKLKRSTKQINLDLAWKIHGKQIRKVYGEEGLKIFERKLTLILRPLKKLLENPHLLMGWLSFQNSKPNQNPVQTLAELYHYLRLEQHPGVPPSEQIWPDDQKLLDSAINFYKDLKSRTLTEASAFGELETLDAELPPACAAVAAGRPDGSGKVREVSEPPHFENNPQLRQQIRGASRGHQLGLELLQLPVILAEKTAYFDFRSNDSLEVEIPEEFCNPQTITELVTELAPPPPADSDEILAWSGGTFYSRETPEGEEYVQIGQHIEEGQVLGLLEVMKMFNPLRAEFSGIVREICVEAASGIIVARGQTLFKIDPDVPAVSESEEEILQRQEQQTTDLLANIVCFSGSAA